MKKKVYLIIIFVLFLAYCMASILDSSVSDILSPIFNIGTGLLIIYFVREINILKLCWWFLGAMCILWGITDVHWAYYALFTDIDPNELTMFTYLYLIPNLLLLASATYYFIKNISKWNKLQLLVDTMLVAVIVLGMGSALFFSKMDITHIGLTDFVGLVLYAITDIFTLTIVLTVVASNRFSNLSKSFRLITLAYILYVTADLMYIDSYVNNTYLPNSLTDIMFLLSFYLFAAGAFLAIKEPLSMTEKFNRNLPSNFGRTKVLWWISITPLVFYLFGRVSIKHLMIFMFASLLYMIFSHYVQKSMMTDLLLAKEKEMKKELEIQVEKKTHELRVSRDALERKSITDSLTGLFNRDYFLENVEKRVQKKVAFSIISIDLNHFNVISDLYGHEMGDKIIKVITERLKRLVSIRCDLCRTNGDVFTIITDMYGTDELEAVCLKIIGLIKEMIFVDQFQFTVEACIGVARYPKDSETSIGIIKSASVAMHQAKTLLTDHKHVIYSSHLIERLERRNHLEVLLKNADYKKEFSLYYQPQFKTETKELFAMEALIRWHHPVEGFISPGEFIPIAEETGLILSISDWVFREAMTQIKRWQDTYHRNLVVGINLSPISISAIDFFVKLQNLIQEIGVEPALLDFEITEHSAMNTSTMMEEMFVALSSLGVNVSIDDFGTGYSSLSYIKRFDIDTLKIAKELIDNIETEYDDQLIVKAIVMMAKGMGLKTIAEGVETEEQFEHIKAMGCDAIQGYYLGKPTDADTFEETYLKQGLRNTKYHL